MRSLSDWVFWDSWVGPQAAPVHLSAGAERLNLRALTTHAAQAAAILRDRWDFNTTYATTYGWVSAGIRRELMAPPPSEKRLGRDQTGLKVRMERLATNQKVAGSSPAERATQSAVLQAF
jgi:hypothetical protein